jgi:hypothetical protein
MVTRSLSAARLSRPLFPLVSWFIESRIDLSLVLPFILFFFLQLAHHQMWRDETNAWALAARSRTLGELFYFARNEAHPYLWYILLWIASRATASVLGLKFVAAIVGAANYLVLALFSPFSRLEKLLFFCSYYISFEYSVLARMYGIMLLLVLLYLRSRTSRPYSVSRNAVWLGLIANTDTFGVLLTFALSMEYLLFLGRGPSRSKLQWHQRILPGAIIYVLCLVVSFASLVPTKQVSKELSKGGPLAHWRERIHLSAAVRAVALDSWYPVDSDVPRHYWNVSHERHITDIFLALALIAAGLQFRREKRLMFMLAFYGSVLIAFMHLVYEGSSRHYGTMFVAFLAALWIQRSEDAKRSISPSISAGFEPRPPRYALIPLGVCAWAGIVVAYASWTHPFSQARAASQWIRANDYDGLPLAGTPDYAAVNVAEHLGRPMYFPECNCTDTFMQFWNRRDHFSQAQLPGRLALAVGQARQHDLIYVGVRALTNDELRALANHSIEARPLAQFTGAEEPEENFFLYELRDASLASKHLQGGEHS